MCKIHLGALMLFLTFGCSPKTYVYRARYGIVLVLNQYDSSYKYMYHSHLGKSYTSYGKYALEGDSILLKSAFQNKVDSSSFLITEGYEKASHYFTVALPRRGISAVNDTEFIFCDSISFDTSMRTTYFKKALKGPLTVHYYNNYLPYKINRIVYPTRDYGKYDSFEYQIKDTLSNFVEIIPLMSLPPSNFIILNEKFYFDKRALILQFGNQEYDTLYRVSSR